MATTQSPELKNVQIPLMSKCQKDTCAYVSYFSFNSVILVYLNVGKTPSAVPREIVQCINGIFKWKKVGVKFNRIWNFIYSVE